MAMIDKKVRALKLRRQGWSIGDIAKKVGVAKSTSSMWCRDISLTEEQIRRLAERDARALRLGGLKAAENRRTERLQRMDLYGRLGRKEVGRLSNRDLFILRVGLYWAEGAKKERQLIFTNSDPLMIRIWIRWLRVNMGITVKDLTCRVGINQLHKNRLSEVEQYWSRLTGVPKDQFRAPSIKKVVNKKVYENMQNHYGTLQVTTKRSANLSYKMLGMISGVCESF